ncbi:hypothetical protein SCAR479_02627 [Seiridium cardinale]|uniref:Uncharacterized protein n=1 Tax=Seiridium cardinale TaxID=138064 RepID=A0ABR2Y3G4_9PEZI
MPNVDAWVANKTATGKNSNCTLENAAARRERSDLSEARRQEYLAAVTCPMTLPPEASTTRFSGALNKYDAFVANNMVVNLGLTSMAMGSNLPKNPRSEGTGPNPRCLRRDVNRDATMGATADRASSLINDNKEWMASITS